MISLFAIISLSILIISITILVLHFKLLKLRGEVDDNFSALDILLRDRLDILFEIGQESPEGQALCTLCEDYDNSPTIKILKALPELKNQFKSIINSDEGKKNLEENEQEIELTIETYNKSIIKFNAHISIFPGIVMACLVGLKQEKPVELSGYEPLTSLPS